MSDDLIQRYEKELAEDPQSRTFAPLAEALRKAGRLDEAIEVARTGLENHPGYSSGLVVLGRALFEKGELDDAAEVLQAAVTDNPESYLGQKFLGKVLKERGKNSEALKALEAANLLSPEDEEVFRLLEEVRTKATPPETMQYDAPAEEEDGKVQIVTYEQKPTTVDGVELPPLHVRAADETFSFSAGEDSNTAEPIPAREESQTFESDQISIESFDIEEEDEEMETTVVLEEDEVQQASEIESMDDLGPEVAAFIREGESIDDDVGEPFGGTRPGPESETLSQAFPEPEGAMAFGAGDTTAPGGPGPEAAPPEEAPAEIPAEATLAEQGQPETEIAGRSLTPPVTAEVTTPPFHVGDPTGNGEVRALDADPVAERVKEESPHSSSEPALTVEAMGGDRAVSDGGLPDISGEVFQVEPAPPEMQTFGEIADPESSPDDTRTADFSTETLADLYSQQGLVEKASAIYNQILSEDPANESVRLKLKALEAGSSGVPAAPSPAVPFPEEVQEAKPGSGQDTDAMLEVLEHWLANAERMKRS